MQCNICKTQVLIDQAWRCGRCGFDNYRVELYTLLYKCQKCGVAPSRVACTSCDATIELVDRGHNETPARILSGSKYPEPKVDPLTDERAKHLREIEDLKRKIELARFRAQLNEAESSAAPKKAETVEEKLDLEIKAYVERIMAQHKAIARAKEQAAEDFGDDSDGLEKVTLALEEWREAHMQP